MFQCSSASRKFLNQLVARIVEFDRYVSVLFSEPKIPQFTLPALDWLLGECFSALQRAENSSIAGLRALWGYDTDVSVLFSEPKIPQFSSSPISRSAGYCVSVLFSEPKIPQYNSASGAIPA